MHRLRLEQALTPTDLNELERMLADAGSTPALIQSGAEDTLGGFAQLLNKLEEGTF